MNSIGICLNKDCIHNKNCERYKTEDNGFTYKFKNICNENNDYKYLMKTEKSVVENK